MWGDPHERNVYPRWNVAEVEQALVSQVDWFGMEQVRRYHAECGEVPNLPHLTELLNGRHTEVWSWFQRRGSKAKTRTLHGVQNEVHR